MTLYIYMTLDNEKVELEEEVFQRLQCWSVISLPLIGHPEKHQNRRRPRCAGGRRRSPIIK